MIAADPAHPFRDFAAPRDHGSALMDPHPAELPDRLRANRELVSNWQLDLLGHSVADVRRRARRDLLAAAIRYTRVYRDLPVFDQRNDEIPLVMAGHQPELFHPGVWFKNFVLSRVGVATEGVAVNLVVDNDLSGAASVRVPQLVAGHLTLATVPYDGPASLSVPFEQRMISDRSLFDSFDVRLRESVRGVVADPLVTPLWVHARRAANRCSNIGCSLAQARHALEGDIGLATLELPISVVCRSWSFATFVLALSSDLPELHASYNESLFAYRAAHGIRSNAHPVPALAEEESWFEVPLWIYGDDDPRRRAAWARRQGSLLEISDRHGKQVRVDFSRGESAAIDHLLSAMGSTFKLRPRALVTTMFARLILSDLFLHGIGGAKYDQLGDTIIRRLLRIDPPDYGVLSATLLLPDAPEDFSANVQRQLLRELRDLRFSPERFQDRATVPEELVGRKRELLANVPAGADKREWHYQLDSLNREMRAHLDEVAREIEQQLAKAREESREDQIWRSREHPFPVHPLGRTIEIFNRLLK